MSDQIKTADKSRPDPERAAFSAFMPEFLKESDRAAVVLGAAKIDSLLCSLIDKMLLPHPGSDDDLLEGDAPLATFSARIRIAHRLGIIDSEFSKLLHILRRLRNTFAHEISQSSLTTGGARDRVVSLSEPFRQFPYYSSMLTIIAREMKRDVHDPGVLFRGSLAMFYVRLYALSQAVSRMKPGSDESVSEWVGKLKDFGAVGTGRS